MTRTFVGLGGQYYYHAVNHLAGEYVRHLCIHTNGIEGAWSLLKRQITAFIISSARSTFTAISQRWLGATIAEGQARTFGSMLLLHVQMAA
jgi:hypothetical protein